MKLSDGFDARRLRPKGPALWRWRICSLLSTLIALAGLLTTLYGAAILLARSLAMPALDQPPSTGALLLAGGILLLLAGLGLRRRCKRRLTGAGDLSLSPHLMKKRG